MVYVGQTRMPLRNRLGSNGYAAISSANTLAREAGRTNGGQQTNCRVNALANAAIAGGGSIRDLVSGDGRTGSRCRGAGMDETFWDATLEPEGRNDSCHSKSLEQGSSRIP